MNIIRLIHHQVFVHFFHQRLIEVLTGLDYLYSLYRSSRLAGPGGSSPRLINHQRFLALVRLLDELRAAMASCGKRGTNVGILRRGSAWHCWCVMDPVAARSKIKGGRSGDCQDRTGADEGSATEQRLPRQRALGH